MPSPEAALPCVVVLFSPGGLGDRGYNDRILRGIQTVVAERDDFLMLYNSPHDLAEAERIFGDWLKLKGAERPSLFILAANEYEEMATRLLTSSASVLSGKDILLFESENPRKLPFHHFRIQMYGACYLAGVTAAATPASSALIVRGNSRDEVTLHAAEGFSAGFRTAGKEAETTALADDWTGYAAAGEAYDRMFRWTERHGFVFPLAGGSNQGIYRFAREYPRGLFTAGMDVEQSALSTRIVGSVVKRIDRLVAHHLRHWLDTGTLPAPAVYGLESGYIDWELAPDYRDVFQETVTARRAEAVEKEKAYEKNR